MGGVRRTSAALAVVNFDVVDDLEYMTVSDYPGGFKGTRLTSIVPNVAQQVRQPPLHLLCILDFTSTPTPRLSLADHAPTERDRRRELGDVLGRPFKGVVVDLEDLEVRHLSKVRREPFDAVLGDGEDLQATSQYQRSEYYA
jgi:hypothetical protein